jgi:valine--pyruvate aminotransferase
MDDLGAAMAGDDRVMMLGGGNPAHIPEILDLLAARAKDCVGDAREFRRMVADYSAPAGEVRFRTALADLLRREYGWSLGPENIALTGGSQTGFFELLNMLAGEFDDGSFRRILLPLTPEYAGYADLGISQDIFVARKPRIKDLGDHMFKYHVDFDGLQIDDGISAICMSRPTNPTGNVATDEEVRKLAALARRHEVPLIIDNAYGMPFPGIVFRDIEPYWDDNVILCMSLSKIGLPAVRTGIIIACEEIIDAMSSVNAIISLAVSSVGPVLVRDLVESGRIIEISRDIIRPFYWERSQRALEWLHQSLAGCNYRVHRPEGAFFLWLWLPDLKITSEELYCRLKERGVYVLPGHHFFPGLEEDWAHRDQCLRISYSRSSEMVRDGIAIIGEEVRKACDD